MLLQHKAVVDSRDARNRTPLHHACSRDYDLQIARQLIKNKAFVTAKDRNNLMPLHIAVEDGNYQGAKLLLEHKANVRARTFDRKLAPIHCASTSTNHDFLRLLVNHDPTTCLHSTRSFELPLHIVTTVSGAHFLMEETLPYMAFKMLHPKTFEAEGARTPLETTRFSFSNRLLYGFQEGDEPLEKLKVRARYLMSYDLPLAVPCTAGKQKRDSEESVNLNPAPNNFQCRLAEQCYFLLRKTMIHKVSYVIMGYLTCVETKQLVPQLANESPFPPIILCPGFLHLNIICNKVRKH
jgi:hypothetical protein